MSNPNLYLNTTNLSGKLRPGFPKYTYTERSYKTMLEYVALESVLTNAQPNINDYWETYPGVVSRSQIEPLPGTTYSVMKIDVEYFFDGESPGTGQVREVRYELDWIAFERDLKEHPEFAPGAGGTYELTDGDIADIGSWKNEKDEVLKKAYQWELSETGEGTLTDNAKRFARGVQLGIETFEDYAPVIRKTSTYVNGMPSSTEAGQKDTPDTFTGRPTGYEWRKNADRIVRIHGQTRIDRVEEWIGAKEVLIDKDEIFWDAPA